MQYKFCSLNGRIIDPKDANISVFNIEYTYGFGVYENIRVVNGTPYFLFEHLDRLIQSARMIGLEHPLTPTIVSQWIEALLKRLPSESYNLKILLIGGKTSEDAQCYILPLPPMFPKKEWYQKGVSMVSVQYERPFPQAKTLSMLPSYLAYRIARSTDCYDALAIDGQGNIREGTRTNIILVKGKTLFKPPQELILAGVTQEVVLQCAKKLKLLVKQQSLAYKALRKYGGALLMSTSVGVVPIKRIDDYEFKTIPPLVRTLGEAYDAFVRRKHPQE